MTLADTCTGERGGAPVLGSKQKESPAGTGEMAYAATAAVEGWELMVEGSVATGRGLVTSAVAWLWRDTPAMKRSASRAEAKQKSGKQKAEIGADGVANRETTGLRDYGLTRSWLRGDG